MGFKERKPYDDIDKYEYSRKYSRIINRIFAVVIPVEIFGMIFFTKFPFSTWEYNKTLAAMVSVFFIIWYVVNPFFMLAFGCGSLAGKRDGWKPNDSTDRSVRMNSPIAFLGLVVSLIVIFICGEIAEKNGVQAFLLFHFFKQ